MAFNKEIFFDLINIYGESYFIHFKNKYKHQTKLGIFFGVISLLTFIILGLVFFFDIFNRNSFSLFIYNQLVNDSYINLTNTPFMFSLIDSYGNYIAEDKKLFKLEVFYINNTINETISLPLINCADTSYKDTIIKYFDIKDSFLEIGNYSCINYHDQILLKELLADNNKSNLEIYVKICNNNSNEECYDKDEIEHKLINGYFIMGYIENYIDHYNFKKPIQNKSRYEIFHFSFYINKFISYVFEESYYESDSGFIFPNIKLTQFFEFKNYNIDFEINEDYFKGNLLEIKFYNNNKCTFYKRKYKKFQDCVSNLESYINTIYKCCAIFIYLSSRKIIYRDLINNLILADEPIRKVKSFKLKSISNDSNVNKTNLNSTSLNNINENCKCLISPMLIKSNSNSKNIKKKYTSKLYNKISNELSLVDDKKDKSNLKLINFKHYQYILPTFIEPNNKNIIIYNKLKEIVCSYLSMETIYKTCNLVYDKKKVKNLIKRYNLSGEKI